MTTGSEPEAKKIREISNRGILATSWTWAGDVYPGKGDEWSPIDIATRLEAVAAAGYVGLGFDSTDLMHIAEATGLGNLKRMIDDHGFTVVELEFINHWWSFGKRRADSDYIRRALFDAAADLGVEVIKVGAEMDVFRGEDEPVDMDHFAREFDALATDADRHGLKVAIEAMPMSNLRTLAQSVDFVRSVGNRAGGVAVDVWHVGRSGDSYVDTVATLPMEYVFQVELSDADQEVRGNLTDDTVHYRRLPGEGTLETAKFAAAVHDAGWRGVWGVEIMSEIHRARDIKEAVADAFAATIDTLDLAESIVLDSAQSSSRSSS